MQDTTIEICLMVPTDHPHGAVLPVLARQAIFSCLVCTVPIFIQQDGLYYARIYSEDNLGRKMNCTMPKIIVQGRLNFSYRSTRCYNLYSKIDKTSSMKLLA